MTVLPRIEAFAEDLTAIRRDIHAHPEIGFEEARTAGLVAELLESWGIEAHRGVGRTGVVGVLRGAREGARAVGLRADMDALPIHETTNLPWRSTVPGVMHACGHDGHTTMLLGAARYLAETRDFAGTVHFVFQPAEEGLGGARAMLADGLFERFPCDEIYGLHNAPNLDLGQVAVLPGRAMAGASFFDIRVHARGSHAARPQDSRDPVVIAAALVQALQSVVSRNVDPLDAGVLSVTRLQAGSAYNVIPEEAHLAGTIRFFDDRVGALVAERVRAICAGIAQAFDCRVEADIRDVFTVLENDPEGARAIREAAAEVVGEAGLVPDPRPVTGSEDFADMLRAVPGAYAWVGHGGDVPLHNPAYVLDDAVLPIGASILARLVERRLA